MRRILQIGLGPVGRRLAAELHRRGLGRVVAAVDPSPELVGRSLAELVPECDAGIAVAESVDAACDAAAARASDGSPTAALVATSSDLAACAPTLRAVLERGLSVVGTCEELAWPWLRHAELARELDALARERSARLLGTGVNPGFLMDALPAVATAVCRDVRSIEVERVQDASPRRVPFQRKIGAGLALDEFERRAATGVLRHVGLGESLHLLAHAVGWSVERWDETLEPLVAERALECALGPIEAGRAAGVRQVARGWCEGRLAVRLEFRAAIGQAEPHDRVRVEGEPAFELRIPGGVDGDVATAAVVLNALAPLASASPGLHTMADVPLVAFRAR